MRRCKERATRAVISTIRYSLVQAFAVTLRYVILDAQAVNTRKTRTSQRQMSA